MTFSWDFQHCLSDRMEVSVQMYALLLSGAVLLTVILLTGLCLRCRRHNMPTSIQQRFSEDYRQPSPGFSLARPPYPSAATICNDPPSSFLSPLSPQRPNSVTPNGNVYVNDMKDSDEDEQGSGSGYLVVLPSEIPRTEFLHHSHQSLVSISSQSTEPPYVNIETEKDTDNANSGADSYVNLESMENSDISDGEDNYVNTKDM
ncbi:linker for activation of T-cells family member 1 isoform X2 [Esox lucius]|uniref:linker for activation of T-cells family member 1 isoform X2 n=1 Tax=Esox lucius TaxID=8010 RepID=UPI0009731AC1|nr:linker for activation of T-cells family member 1 isoform X2 [Esox lucius]